MRYESASPRASLSGDIGELSLWAGQGVGLVHEVLPAGEIVRRVTAQAQEILDELAEGQRQVVRAASG